MFLFMLVSVNAISTNNLISYYTFDENNSISDYTNFKNFSSVDATFYDNVGLINGSYEYSSASNFLGSNVYSSTIMDNHTISLWFLKNSTDLTTEYIFSSEAVLNIYLVNGVLTSSFFDGLSFITLVSNTSYMSNDWNNVVITKNDSGVNMYLNNVLVANQVGDFNLALDSFARDTRLGSYYSGSVNRFNGWIDEMAVFSRSISITEIDDIYNSGSGLRFITENASEENETLSLDVVISLLNPPTFTNYTFDVSYTTLQLSTNISANCSYYYNNTQTQFTTTGLTMHSSNFSMGSISNESRVYEIVYSCENTFYNTTTNLTSEFYRQGEPLELEILVPQENQVFIAGTADIQYYLMTNYVTICSYKTNDELEFTEFAGTNNIEHVTNYNLTPNVYSYTTTFFCEGVFISENVSGIVNYFLNETEQEIVIEYFGISKTTQYLPAVGADIGGFLTGLAPGVVNFILNLAIVTAISLILYSVFTYIKNFKVVRRL